MSKMMTFVKSFRLSAALNDKKRDFGLNVPDDIDCIFDLQYTGEDRWNRLDIYKPKGASEPLPVIIDCHGGGWIYGDKELYQFYCMSLAERGFAVVNFSYHLAPDYDFYTQLCEVNEVVKFTINNAEAYGLDRNNIFMSGDSAGATMCANYTNICTNKAYSERFAFDVPDGFVPRAVLLNCGAFSSSDGSPEIFEALFGKDYDDKIRDMDVLDNLTPDFPPCYVATAPDDFLRDSCYQMRDKLIELGVDLTFKEYSAEDKKLGHCFHVDMKSRYAHMCNDEQCEFLKKYCN